MDEKVGVAVAAAFAGDRLSMISPYRRGQLLEDLAKRVLERRYPGSYFQDPPASTCLNGRRRSKHQAEWDGTFLGRRVEIKTARLSYSPTTDTWDLSFYGIKLARDGRASQAFDDLYLLSFAPDGFHLLKHDLKLGLSTRGVRTVQHGHVVRLRGGCGQSWKESLRTLLANLAMAGCKLVETISKRDPLVRAMYRRLSMAQLPLGDRVYKDTPWHTMSPALRSQRVERVCFEFDQMLNPDSTFSSAAGELDTRGHRRGVNNAAVDWIRDRTRVEVKYAKLHFCVAKNCWRCCFSNIKVPGCGGGRTAYFDELWLVIYSPQGLHIFKHLHWRAHLCSGNWQRNGLGRPLMLSAKTNDHCVNSALNQMQVKLEAAGADFELMLVWDS